MQTQHDTVQKFLLETVGVHGEMIHLTQSYQTIIEQRPYPPLIRQLLGEALVACTLLAAQLKFAGSYSLQFNGDERLSLLLVQGDDTLGLRGLAKYQEACTDEQYAEAFLKGQMILTLRSEQYPTQNYQSTLAIDSLSIARNLMYYFEQSEQRHCFLSIATNATQASGFFIQQLPAPTDLHAAEQHHTDWDYASHIAKTLTDSELLTLDNETLLHRLYHETTVRVFEKIPTAFRCRCTPERLTQALKVLGHEECLALLSTHKTIEACCEFCNQKYHFDATDISKVFSNE